MAQTALTYVCVDPRLPDSDSDSDSATATATNSDSDSDSDSATDSESDSATDTDSDPHSASGAWRPPPGSDTVPRPSFNRNSSS